MVLMKSFRFFVPLDRDQTGSLMSMPKPKRWMRFRRTAEVFICKLPVRQKIPAVT